MPQDNGDEDILDNMEGEDEYDDIETDFQGTMKKLRGIAKVCVVANKVRSQLCCINFVRYEFYSKLIGRKPTAAVFKRNNSYIHVNTTNLSRSS